MGSFHTEGIIDPPWHDGSWWRKNLPPEFFYLFKPIIALADLQPNPMHDSSKESPIMLSGAHSQERGV